MAAVAALIAVVVLTSVLWAGLTAQPTTRQPSGLTAHVSPPATTIPATNTSTTAPAPTQKPSVTPATPATHQPHGGSGSGQKPVVSAKPDPTVTTVRQAIPYPSKPKWDAMQQQMHAAGAHYAQDPGDLAYYGGPVQHSPTTYLIFWGPSWTTTDSGTAAVVESYFNDLSGSSFENILTQYYDSTNGAIANIENFSSANVYFDTSTPPTDNTCAGGVVNLTEPSVEDVSLRQEVQNAIAARGWPSNGSNGVYLVYTPNGDYINGPGSMECNYPAYQNGGWCAYHDVFSASTSLLEYAAMPYPGSGCRLSDAGITPPSGNVEGDSLVNLQSHEEFETITDPQLNAWIDSYGYEIGDKCAWVFPTSGSNPNGYTTLNNGGTFAMQMEYSNASRSCVNTYNGVPTVMGSSPDYGLAGTSVTIRGASFTGATSVAFNGTSATFTLNNPSEITTTVPAGATTGPISVTTPSGTGSAGTSFVISAQPPAPIYITNGGFEGVDTLGGNLGYWTTSGTTSISGTAHTGKSSAMLGATTATNGDSSISQTVNIASGDALLSFWYQAHCPGSVANEWATATVFDITANTTTTVLAPTCTNTGSWVPVTANLSAMVGHTVTVTLTNHDDNNASDPAYTLFDDVALVPVIANPVVNFSFEGSGLDNQSGNLNPGWTLSGTNYGGTAYPETPGYMGGWAAVVGWDTPTDGDNVLSQTFTVPSGATTISLWYMMYCTTSTSTDWATVTLYDNTTGTTTTVMPKICDTSYNAYAWSQVSAPINQMVGHVVTIHLIDHDSHPLGSGGAGYGTFTYFDDIVVS